MSDPVTGLNAALSGRYAIERELKIFKLSKLSFACGPYHQAAS